jgi:hypothetical protein
LSLISSNVGGFTKRSVISATLFVAYCVGNIIGPQFFLASQEPKYQVRVWTIFPGHPTNTRADWAHRLCLGPCNRRFVPDRPVVLLYLGESTQGQAIRSSSVLEYGGRVGG